ncbi:transcriptional regulatory protein DegU [mine drainage metagenome]|uniref:Transcriptional regulatory protein DegU n=1 Tax=mine drainage metagenome TaxID=410659 RepID=A0A1J5Q7G1_9ZZZZ
MNAAETIRHVFVDPAGVMRPGWLAAFPSARVSRTIPTPENVDVLWMLLPDEGDMAALITEARRKVKGKPVIALTDVPEDAQGLQVLGAGAVGYCNGYALAEVLTQVAATVLNGGVWIGPSLMQRLVSGAARRQLGASTPSVLATMPAWQTLLTEREVEVANELSLGATNKEIANNLLISERTVKAHLGSIFEKLNVRDRLQLILRLNSTGHA